MLNATDPRIEPIAELLRQLARNEGCPVSFRFGDGERLYSATIRLDGTDPAFDREVAKVNAQSGDYSAAEELERRVLAGRSLEAIYESHRASLIAIADGCSDAQDYRGRELVFELLGKLAAMQQHFRLTERLVEASSVFDASPLVIGVRTPGARLAGEGS